MIPDLAQRELWNRVQLKVALGLENGLITIFLQYTILQKDLMTTEMLSKDYR